MILGEGARENGDNSQRRLGTGDQRRVERKLLVAGQSLGGRKKKLEIGDKSQSGTIHSLVEVNTPRASHLPLSLVSITFSRPYLYRL